MQKSVILAPSLPKTTGEQRQTTSLSPLVATLYPLVIAGVLFGVRYVPVETLHHKDPAAPAYTTSAESYPTPSQNHPSRDNDGALKVSTVLTPTRQLAALKLQPFAAPTLTENIASFSPNVSPLGGFSVQNVSALAGIPLSNTIDTNKAAVAGSAASGEGLWSTRNAPLSTSGAFYTSGTAPVSGAIFYSRQSSPAGAALTTNLSALTRQLVALRDLWQTRQPVVLGAASPLHPSTLALNTAASDGFTRLRTRGASVNLVANPSFEDLPNHYNLWTGALGATAFGGGQDIRTLGSNLTNSEYSQPAGGAYNAVLFNDSSQCIVGQAVTLVAGTSYTLAFDTMTTGQINSGSAVFSVYFGTGLPADGFTSDAMALRANVGFTTITQTTISASQPNPVNAMPLSWATVHETFTSTQSGSFYLSFLQTGPGTTASDANFDRIALIIPSSSATPEPSSLALFAFLLFPAAKSRRKRAASYELLTYRKEKQFTRL